MRRHKLSQTSVTAQSYVLVRVRLANGAEGIGEAATLGGPRWSEESVEAMKANIDAYLAPAVAGQRADLFEAAGLRMDQAAKRNNAAKAAVETALFDAVGKTLGLPAAALLGGAVRDRFPVLWTLASGDPAQEVDEAERKLEARLHRTFKVKVGAQAPEADMARMRHLARALEGRAELIVDANQAWDETVAARCLPQLAEMGVRLVEQPVPAWNIGAMARLRARPGTPPLLADECVFDAHDMLAVGQAAAADAVSLKLVKHAGLLGVARWRRWRRRRGSAFTAAACWRARWARRRTCRCSPPSATSQWGCEHFGPQILTGEYVAEPLRFEDYHVHMPTAPGIGVVLDEDKLRHYARQ